MSADMGKKFCRKCGKEAKPGDKFCLACGTRFEVQERTVTEPSSSVVKEPIPGPKFCKKCGGALTEGAKFCLHCGASVYGTSPSSGEGLRSAVNEAVSEIASEVKETVSDTVSGVAEQMSASWEPGEICIGEVSVGEVAGQMEDAITREVPGLEGVAQSVSEFTQTAADVQERADAILSPLKTLMEGVRFFIKGITGFVKNPKTLIITILMAVIWAVLGLLRESDAVPVKILSWLTFSEGGLDRGLLGAIGGAFGKGTVVVALVSLFSGGLGKAVKGVAALFKGNGEKSNVVYIVIGLALGVALYFVFAGIKTASVATTMAGISGMLLSLEALGGRSGWIFQMARSLTSKVQNRMRSAVESSMSGLLTGMTAGFALVTVLSVFLNR